MCFCRDRVETVERGSFTVTPFNGLYGLYKNTHGLYNGLYTVSTRSLQRSQALCSHLHLRTHLSLKLRCGKPRSLENRRVCTALLWEMHRLGIKVTAYSCTETNGLYNGLYSLYT